MASGHMMKGVSSLLPTCAMGMLLTLGLLVATLDRTHAFPTNCYRAARYATTSETVATLHRLSMGNTMRLFPLAFAVLAQKQMRMARLAHLFDAGGVKDSEDEEVENMRQDRKMD